MKTSVETLSPTRVKLTVEIPFAEMSESVEAAYRTIAEQVTIPGFRKGKVPSSIIDQRVGRGAVLQEAINLFEGTVILVSHDRSFLDGVVNKVLEVSPGSTRMLTCNVSEYIERIEQEADEKLGK